MPVSHDYDGAFKGLRRLLKAHAAKLHVKRDAPGEYILETKEAVRKGERFFVASVKKTKTYVSMHLIALYIYPDLLSKISPALKKRKQGKACFNFTAPDPVLFEELSELFEAGLAAFKKRGIPW